MFCGLPRTLLIWLCLLLSTTRSTEINNAKAALTTANSQKRLASTEEEHKDAQEAVKIASDTLTAARLAAKEAYMSTVADPFDSIKNKENVRISCFQLINYCKNC